MGDSDPRALFGYVVRQLDALGIAYVHIIEPRVKGADTIAESQSPRKSSGSSSAVPSSPQAASIPRQLRQVSPAATQT
jgi:hypothetical protein